MSKRIWWQEVRARSSALAYRAIRCHFWPVLFLWILFVLYPNPLNVGVSLYRAYQPDVDPLAIGQLGEFPSEAASIDALVKARVPYSYDWTVYGMPWYFPTTRLVVEQGMGDCKGRAIVLASVLEAKDIPYRIISSPIHIWVEYDGKEQTTLENEGVSFYQHDPETGERLFRLPDIPLRDVLDSSWSAFWEPMPVARKLLLVSGIAGLVCARVLLSRNGRKVLTIGRSYGNNRETS